MNQQFILAIALSIVGLLIGCQRQFTSKPADNLSSSTVLAQNNTEESPGLLNSSQTPSELDNGGANNSGGSSLTGKVSNLEGLISDLNSEVSESEIIFPLPTDVLFDFDKAELRQDAIPTLEKLAQAIAKIQPQSIQINGHTDAKGTPAYNLKLSEERAQTIATWLANNTDLDNILTTKGHGESQPVADNQFADGRDNPEGRAKNRRVEVIIPK